MWWTQKGPRISCKHELIKRNLTSETVQGTSLPLEGVDYVHSGDGLPLGVLGVGNGIADNVLQEYLEDTSGLLVDKAGNTLDTTSAGQTTDGGLGNTLDIITQNFTVTFCAPLAEALTSLSASCHDD